MAALALAFGACGGGEPTIGAVATVTTTIPTTTSTLPPTTTTTIDFDRPIDQGTEPLVEDAEPADIAEVIDDLRGQSADVAGQVERLAPFPPLAGPTAVQIIDVAVALGPEVDDLHPATATVRYRTPEPGPAMVEMIGDDMRSLIWNKVDEVVTPTPGGESTEMVFNIVGRTPDELQLEAVIVSADGPTVVELTYLIQADPDEVDAGDGITHFERLSAWSEALPLPRAADLVEVAVATADDVGTLTATYRLDDDDEAEAVARVTAAAAGGGGDYQLLGADADDPPATGPLRLAADDGTIVNLDFALDPDDETIRVEATITFPLTPID